MAKKRLRSGNASTRLTGSTSGRTRVRRFRRGTGTTRGTRLGAGIKHDGSGPPRHVCSIPDRLSIPPIRSRGGLGAGLSLPEVLRGTRSGSLTPPSDLEARVSQVTDLGSLRV